MSSVSKGNAYELEAKKTLEACGWKVFRQHRKPIFIKGKMVTIGCDIFGCDLVAKVNGGKSLWVQVSTAENLAAKKAQVLAHPTNPQFENYEIWIRVNGKKEFEVHRLEMTDVGLRWNKQPSTVKVRINND